MQLDETTPSSGQPYLSKLASQLDEPAVFGKLVLWIKLSCGKVPGFQFVHDYSIAGYLIDFYCPAIKLGIDVEAVGEKRPRRLDQARRAALEAHGILQLNFTDEEISEHTDDVLEHIRILATAFGRMPQTG